MRDIVFGLVEFLTLISFYTIRVFHLIFAWVQDIAERGDGTQQG